METFSTSLALCAPVNSPHKGQWCGALMFSLICAWTNGWINNRERPWWFEMPSCSLWCHCNDSLLPNFDPSLRSRQIHMSVCSSVPNSRTYQNRRTLRKNCRKINWKTLIWTIYIATNKCISGGRLNKKDGLTRYGDPHVKDKTS